MYWLSLLAITFANHESSRVTRNMIVTPSWKRSTCIQERPRYRVFRQRSMVRCFATVAGNLSSTYSIASLVFISYFLPQNLYCLKINCRLKFLLSSILSMIKINLTVPTKVIITPNKIIAETTTSISCHLKLKPPSWETLTWLTN